MSLFHSAQAVCGKCKTETPVDLAVSVNADRRPDLRQAILDGSFQGMQCPECGASIRLPAHLSYLDVGRGQWMLVDTFEASSDWSPVEEEAGYVFDLNFGAAASPVSREIGAGLTPRLVFGWPALREKLICAELALDDVVLEQLKISMLLNIAKPPAGDRTELRLIGGDTDELDFAWIFGASERAIATVAVPRDAYADIAAATKSWAALRAELDGHLYVDLNRLVTPSRETSARLEGSS